MKIRNFIAAAIILTVLATGSRDARAENYNISSQGRIIDDGGTIISTDDQILFDADDFKQIHEKIEKLNQKIREVESTI